MSMFDDPEWVAKIDERMRNASGSESELTSLLACPFCGEEAKDYIGYGKDKVGCHNSECRLYCMAFDRDTWNTRATK